MVRKIALTVAFSAFTLPVAAQSAAQCEQALLVGPGQADPAVMAACMPYFRSLATNAAAPGTFGTVQSGATVTLSTSGTGG